MLTGGCAHTLVCLQIWDPMDHPRLPIHWPLRISVEEGKSLSVCLWSTLTLSLSFFSFPRPVVFMPAGSHTLFLLGVHLAEGSRKPDPQRLEQIEVQGGQSWAGAAAAQGGP